MACKEDELWLAQMDKLEKLCRDNDMDFMFKIDSFPITLTIQPMRDEQMSMEELADKMDKGKDPYAKLVYTLEDGEIYFRSHGTYAVTKSLMDKIKGLFEKMAGLALQFYFRANYAKGGTIIDRAVTKSDGFRTQ